MAITNISRDWGINPSIVRLVTTDTLSTIMTNGYLLAQDANILALQNGEFQWVADDYVLVSYSGGEGFFTHDAVNNSLIPAGGSMQAKVNLTSAQILGMDAAPVQILPALPANFAYVLNRIWCVYTFVSAQYAAGGAIGLEYGATAALAGPAASTTLAAATFNAYAASNTFELTPDGTDTLAHIAGAAISISNATGAFTTGDGTLAVNVNYNIVKVA